MYDWDKIRCFGKNPVILNFIPKRRSSAAWYYRHECIDETFRREAKERPQERVSVDFVLSAS